MGITTPKEKTETQGEPFVSQQAGEPRKEVELPPKGDREHGDRPPEVEPGRNERLPGFAEIIPGREKEAPGQPDRRFPNVPPHPVGRIGDTRD